MTSSLASMLAINWEPELRGILIVIIAVVTLCGSVYLVLATNLGARLGFLVAITGLFGWLALMGLVWMIYGIGLTGPAASWKPVPGVTVLQDTDALYRAGIFSQPIDAAQFDESADESEGMPGPQAAAAVATQFDADGWETLGEEDPEFAQAAAAAGVLLEESGAFAAGEYRAVNVFDIGGDRFPKINESLDFLAFFHEPRHVVVEVAPLVATRTEPGRAPAPAVIDDTRQRQYVYMVRDLGAKRQPAFVLLVGSGIIFLTLCWLLHRRERVLVTNRNTAIVATD